MTTADLHRRKTYLAAAERISYYKSPKGKMFIYDARKPAASQPIGEIREQGRNFVLVVNNQQITKQRSIKDIINFAAENLV